MKDYYQILGVKPEDSQDRIKEVFRKLANIYHPDKGGDKSGEERFKEINEAYQVLGKPDLRAKYDTEWSLEQKKDYSKKSENVTNQTHQAKPASASNTNTGQKYKPYTPKSSNQQCSSSSGSTANTSSTTQVSVNMNYGKTQNQQQYKPSSSNTTYTSNTNQTSANTKYSPTQSQQPQNSQSTGTLPINHSSQTKQSDNIIDRFLHTSMGVTSFFATAFFGLLFLLSLPGQSEYPFLVKSHLCVFSLVDIQGIIIYALTPGKNGYDKAGNIPAIVMSWSGFILAIFIGYSIFDTTFQIIQYPILDIIIVIWLLALIFWVVSIVKNV